MTISSHLNIISFFYIIFSIVALTFVILNIVEHHKISIMNMCSIMFILLLCVVPAIILIGYINGERGTSNIKFDINIISTFYTQLVLTLLGYFFLHLGYKIKQKNIKIVKVTHNEKLLLICSIFSIISTVSLFLWASGFGGIRELIINANAIRAGFISSTNSFSFFKHFVPLSLMSSWMLFNIMVKNEIKKVSKRILVLFLLLCSIVLSFIYIQANDGRMLLAVYVFLFFVQYFKYKYESKKISTASMIFRFIIIFITVVVLLFSADAILMLLRNGTYINSEATNFTSIISKEFSFIISGTQTALIYDASGESKFMLINDVINGLFAWLPTSLKPILLEDVWDFNTRLIASGIYGQTPTTIIAQSVYDLSIVGIVIIPFIYGFIIKKTEKILECREGSAFFETIYIVLGYYLCKGIPYFSCYNILINTFFIFIAILIYNLVQKIK